MENLSRRKFLQQSGTGVAAVGAVSAIARFPGLTGRRRTAEPAVHDSGVAKAEGRATDGPIVVHIPDARTGQLHVMFGTREVVHHDPALVARLVHAAR